MQNRKFTLVQSVIRNGIFAATLLVLCNVATAESMEPSGVTEEAAKELTTESNIYIDRVGSRQAPDSSVNANWVGISDTPVQAEVNTDQNFVRSGTTSIKTVSALDNGEARNIRFDGLAKSAVAGDTVTLTAWFKAENTVRAFVALESPNTSYQSATRGNGDWQQITLSQVSDGGETRFFLVPRGDAIAGPHNVYWDDIEVTITPGNDTTQSTGGRANAFGLFSWDWQDQRIDVSGDASVNQAHFANNQFRHSVAHDSVSAIRVGNQLKFELDPTSPPTNNSDAGNYRKEIANDPWDSRTPLGTEEWIGWQYTFGDDYLPDPADWLFFQSKPIDNGIAASPPVSLVVVSEGAYGSTGGEVMVQNHANPPDNHLTGVFPVAGQTLDIVMHVVHGFEDNGLLQVWIDGTLVYDKQVATVLENTPWGGNPKFGIYAWPWQSQANIDASIAAGITKRTTFLGPLKIYRKRSSDPSYLSNEYNTVAPTTTVTPNSPDLESGKWHQLVVPGDSTNATVRSLFSNALPADQYDQTWAVYLWNNETAAYINPGIDGRMPIGQGFWFIQISGESVILNPPSLAKAPREQSSACPSSNGCTKVSFITPSSTNRFAMMGSAQRFSVSSDSLIFLASDNSGICANGCTHVKAVEAGLVANSIWRYNPTTEEYDDISDGGELNPWESAWFQSSRSSSGIAASYLFPATRVGSN